MHAEGTTVRVFWVYSWARSGNEEVPELEGELVVFEALLLLVFDYPFIVLWLKSWNVSESNSISLHRMLWRL